MTEENTSPAVSVQGRKVPGKGAQIASLILGIISFGVAALSLICTIAIPGLGLMTKQCLWWGGWIFLVAVIVITFIFSSRRFMPSKYIISAGFLGLAAAIMLLINAFLR